MSGAGWLSASTGLDASRSSLAPVLPRHPISSRRSHLDLAETPRRVRRGRIMHVAGSVRGSQIAAPARTARAAVDHQRAIKRVAARPSLAPAHRAPGFRRRAVAADERYNSASPGLHRLSDRPASGAGCDRFRLRGRSRFAGSRAAGADFAERSLHHWRTALSSTSPAITRIALFGRKNRRSNASASSRSIFSDFVVPADPPRP